MNKSRLAILSLSDKYGMGDLANCFRQHGINMISTGGTYDELVRIGFEAEQVSHFTGSPEVFDGRLKTIHPRVAGGTLYIRDNEVHVQQAKDNGILPIDFVAFNLYPFEKTVAKAGVTLEEAIEKIDIGGPSAIRAAAKNYKSVTVLCDPMDYPEFIKEMNDNNGTTTLEFRKKMMFKVFYVMANYEKAIRNYLAGQPGFFSGFLSGLRLWDC